MKLDLLCSSHLLYFGVLLQFDSRDNCKISSLCSSSYGVFLSVVQLRWFCFSCMSVLITLFTFLSTLCFISGGYSAATDSGQPWGCCQLLCKLHTRLWLCFALQQPSPGLPRGQYCHQQEAMPTWNTYTNCDFLLEAVFYIRLKEYEKFIHLLQSYWNSIASSWLRWASEDPCFRANQ